MLKSGIVNIWSDASCRQGRIGLGWVVIHRNEIGSGRQAFTGFLDGEEKHGSLIGEILGVSEILRKVGRQEKVEIRLDSMDVVKALRTKDIRHCFEARPVPLLLENAFQKALHEIALTRKTHIHFEAHKMDNHMHRAHVLSRQASHRNYDGPVRILGLAPDLSAA